MSKNLKISNAHENNLKGISLEIPHNELVVITGLSGSGKSSLAFDTIHAEGQRRYLETFSSYIRQFFDQIKKPDADLIQNIRPSIAIEQKTRIKSSRSTVGSVSGINDYLKIIWNYFSVPVCPSCESTIQTYSPKKAAQFIFELIEKERSSIFVLCAKVGIKKEDKRKDVSLKSQLEKFKTLGLTRIFDFSTGQIVELDSLKQSQIKKSEHLFFAIERIKYGSHQLEALIRIIDKAYSISPSTCSLVQFGELQAGSLKPYLKIINCPDQPNIRNTSRKLYEFSNLPQCEFANTNLSSKRPSLFNYNHPYGACENCKGFGSVLVVDQDKCIPVKSLSIKERAIACWAGDGASRQFKNLVKFCDKRNISTKKPWASLNESDRDLIFNHNTSDFRGIAPWFKRLERKIYKTHVRVFISRYRKEIACPSCQGKRYNRSALSYKIGERDISVISGMPMSEFYEWLSSLHNLNPNLPHQINEVFKEALGRVRYLLEVGLPYLTLSRQSNTLSGGETQRVNLATAIGSNLISTQFVLDEPTVGLHSRDTAKLLKAIKELKSRGNSLLIVEHDLDVIDEADHIIEIGPHAGNLGGEVAYNGPRNTWAGLNPVLIAPPTPISISSLVKQNFLSIKNATARNLKNITVNIPLNQLVTLSGVSGSGKSTLLNEVISKEYLNFKNSLKSIHAESITGYDHIDKVILVDQAPISKTPRGNIATYSGIWDEVRKTLSQTEEAKLRRLTKSSFSFNVDAGRCKACRGAGFIKEDMQFLSDVYIPCDSCLGKRFEQIVLEVNYKGKNIADILSMSVDEAAIFFENSKSISSAVRNLLALGLGYLRLGHSLSELSGGEAQRLKLVSYLENRSEAPCLFLFDEPTTGLHINDIAKLVSLLRSLVDYGHSVITIEHNLTFINASDWIIDMGPEGGEGGGRILFEGTADSLSRSPDISYTAKFLSQYRSANSSSKVIKLRADDQKIKPFKSELIIKGAREHNLKDVNLNVPLNKFVVFTGVSGSGKSSIAKDIIYAEGQRSYLDCLSPYARQFIKELKRPEIDSISGVPPTICVYQHTYQPGRHSTVGTMSEIYSFLRLLYAKIGIQHCPDHPDKIISAQSPHEIASIICQYNSDNVKILSPIIKAKKGFHKNIFERALELEFSQVRVDRKIGSTSKYIEGLDRNKPHTIEYIIANFKPNTANLDLVEEAIIQALSLGSGSIIALTSKGEEVFSTSRSCPICNRGFLKPDPEDLSFSSKRGRCQECAGIGEIKNIPCKKCQGSRLSELGRNLQIAEQTIYDLSKLDLHSLKTFLSQIKLNKNEKLLSDLLISEVLQRIDLLIDFGLSYLPLHRHCTTLSGGELQRLRLAAALGSSLSGVLYILDEPSAGLHPLDNRYVLDKLNELKATDNSIIVIEHDSDTILSADYVIDVGPGGGQNGGNIVYEGVIEDFINCKDSVTAQELKKATVANSNNLKIINKSPKNKGFLTIKGSRHNIKDISINLPLGSLIGVIGVSGSGKSTLIEKMLGETIQAGDKNQSVWESKGIQITSSSVISNLYVVNQKPLGKNSRSVPASYLKVWDEIRKVFAMTPEAKARGWKESYFSFNSGKGRCPECKGMGEIVLEMNFLPSAKVPCDRCRGSRFSEEACTALYANFTISDVLKMTLEEAKGVFTNHKKIHQILSTAVELGIGYISLGQSTTTLSGGEAQRLKLTIELSKSKRENSIYILDEPTSGLHMSDVARLVNALQTLVELGHTVIVIEHDIQVIQNCHHIIELGPGPGDGGGKVIFEGRFSSLLDSNTPWSSVLKEKSDLSKHQNKYSS